MLNFDNKAMGDGLMLISACSLPSSGSLELCRAHPKVKELLLEEMAELLDNSCCPGTADGNTRNPDTPTWKPLPLHRSPGGHGGNHLIRVRQSLHLLVNWLCEEGTGLFLSKQPQKEPEHPVWEN